MVLPEEMESVKALQCLDLPAPRVTRRDARFRCTPRGRPFSGRETTRRSSSSS